MCICLNVMLFLFYIHVYLLIKDFVYVSGIIFSAITTMDDDFNTELIQRYNWYGNMFMNVYY